METVDTSSQPENNSPPADFVDVPDVSAEAIPSDLEDFVSLHFRSTRMVQVQYKPPNKSWLNVKGQKLVLSSKDHTYTVDEVTEWIVRTARKHAQKHDTVEKYRTKMTTAVNGEDIPRFHLLTTILDSEGGVEIVDDMARDDTLALVNEMRGWMKDSMTQSIGCHRELRGSAGDIRSLFGAAKDMLLSVAALSKSNGDERIAEMFFAHELEIAKLKHDEDMAQTNFLGNALEEVSTPIGMWLMQRLGRRTKPVVGLPKHLSEILDSLTAEERDKVKEIITEDHYDVLVKAAKAPDDEKASFLIGKVIDDTFAKGEKHVQSVFGRIGEALGEERAMKMAAIFNTVRPMDNKKGAAA